MVGAASALLLLGTSLIPVGKARTVHLVMAGLVAVTATSLWHRMPPAQRLLATDPPPGIEIDRYEDALTLNQVMQGADGQRVLLTDLQHMDAATDPASVQIQQDQVRLPLVLHPHPRTLLLLGLGTGISASAAHELPDLHIEAADISPGAIRAAQTWFAPVNHRIMDRVVAHADDARHFLGSSQAQYDIIVGDLFHPDLAGMSSLLSVEQFARARAHLSDGGVFIQWVALNQFDQDSLFTVLRSFRVVFPQGVLFLDGMHLALAGSVGVVPEQLMAEALRRGDRTPLPNGTDDTVTWMGRYLGPIPATTGPTENERRPHIEYRLAHLHYTSEPPIAPLLARLRQQRPGADNTANRLGLTGEQRNAFVSAHAATSMAMQSWEAALAGRAEQALTLVHLAHEANPHDHWMASALADERFEQWQTSGTAPDPRQLQNILDIFPEHLDARRTLWHWLREAGQTTAAAQQAERLRQLAPLDPEFANLAPITSKAVNPGVVSGP
jgi:spermidine synthase